MKRGVPAAAPLVSAISIAAVLFVSLGRVDVPWAWAYVALWFGFATATVIFVDPVLLRERVRPGPGARESLAVASMAAASVWYGHLVVAGLDVGRFHWSDRVPSAARLAGFATLASAFAAIGWALVVNPFFSSVIRVQTER
ncbi:MAG: hypothetical protein QOD06_2092, partial [Candidatus Binatota bacterium]|nr:hypothetical protein [Candidatus Binatota bacterium]